MSKDKPLKIGTDFSGVGAFDQALRRLGIEYETVFACDMDEYARQTFCLNYGTENDIKLVMSKKHSELSKKIKRIVEKNEVFESKHKPLFDEATAFAKQFSFYFDWNVYNREIPEEPLDIYVPTPPCQSFSIAGKRGGESDKRGVLFYNSHNFIKVNKPKFFIFENVQGLLSDDNGKTFQRWVDYLGGKSINGYPTFFPHDESVPYHIYYKVLNAKHYGIPQNRDRIFIIGIRDDVDDNFYFPQKIQLVKKLRDCLEEIVDEKYFLSKSTIEMYVKHTDNQKAKGNGFRFEPSNLESATAAITTRSGSRPDDNFIDVGTWRTHEDGRGFRPTEDNNCPTISARAREDGSGQPVIRIKSNTEKGFEEMTEGDSLNLSNSNSNTRRGRVGKEIAQTLDTGCNQAVIVKEGYINQDTQASQVYGIDGIVPGICAGSHGYAMGYIKLESDVIVHNVVGKVSVRKHEVDFEGLMKLLKHHKTKSTKAIATHLDIPHTKVAHWFRTDKSFAIPDAEYWTELKLFLGIENTDFDLQITEFEERDNVFEKANRVYDENGISPTLDTACNQAVMVTKPRECIQINPSKESGGVQPYQQNRIFEGDIVNALDTECGRPNYIVETRIRRLTPLECFRLMDFNFGIEGVPDFKWAVSDTQAYKQAGNSICVGLLVLLIKELLKIK